MRVRVLIPVAALAIGLTGCTAQRPEDPGVVTGADLPRLAGAPPGKVLAYHYLNQTWTQVPVQVDERALVDLGSVYNQAPDGIRVLTYTDPATFAGPDPDPTVDSNDEVAFMGGPAGVRAPAATNPPNVVAGSGEELRLHDPVGDPTDAYLYLYRQTGNLDPGAGRRYVTYNFKLLSGDYKSTYKLNAGPNPEDSTVTTASYTQHFSDRWADDALKMTGQGASGVDILDRHKDLFAPGNCGRSEDTFDAGEGAFIANKSGPVRAIRSYVGANSGPLTERQHIFYARREDITTFLRVHAIPGVLDFFDYSPAASGMTYKSSADDARRHDRRRARHRHAGTDRLGDRRRKPGRPLDSPLDPDRRAGPELDLLLPRQAESLGRQRDAVHRRRLGVRLERAVDHPGDPEHRSAHHSVQQPDDDAHALLRVARPCRWREAGRPGGQPPAGVGGAARLGVATRAPLVYADPPVVDTLVRVRRARSPIAVLATALTLLLSIAAPAFAQDPGRWLLTGASSVPNVYWQGLTSDPAEKNLYFIGVFEGLWRTTPTLRQTAGVPHGDHRPPVTQTEGYNHIGDPTWNPREGGRVLLPMECYTPGVGNTCGTGAFGVADPATLAFRYYVKLDPADIPKAMWAETSPDGSLIWTSSGDDLLAYRSADVSEANRGPSGPLHPTRPPPDRRCAADRRHRCRLLARPSAAGRRGERRL